MPPRLKEACLELISTEESYVDTLRTIVTVFLRPLRNWAEEECDSAAGALARTAVEAAENAAAARREQRPDVAKAEAKAKAAWEARTKAATAAAERHGFVTSDDIKLLFGGIETLLEVHSGLLEKLRRTDGDPAGLAMVMVEYADGPLRIYAPHVSHFPAVNELLSRRLEHRSKFKTAVRVL